MKTTIEALECFRTTVERLETSNTAHMNKGLFPPFHDVVMELRDARKLIDQIDNALRTAGIGNACDSKQ